MRLFLYFLATVVCLGGLPGAATAQASPQISVVGQGSVTVKPDILRITVGVVAHDAQAARAVDQMSTELAKVMRALSDAGLPPADIQTSGLRLSERYAENRNYDEPPKVVGFTAQSTVDVIVRDLDRAGGILDTLVTQGANQISGLRFDIADRAPLLAQARIAAIADAMAKTELYAQAAGVKPGAILSISEASSGGVHGGQFVAMAEARSVPIAAGTLDVTAQITVITAIE